MSQRHAEDSEVERLWTSLRQDLSKLGADLHTAEDVAQDAWLIVTHSPPVDRGSMRGWLHVVGTRLLWRWRNREVARARLEHFASRERPSSMEDDTSGESEDLSRLRRYVRELPEPYHSALRLRFFDGREVEEIARLLEVPKWTVHKRIQRGIAVLRTRMTPPEERRNRAYFLVWLRGLRSRWATWSGGPAFRVLTLAVSCLALLAAWVVWTSGSNRNASAEGSEVASSGPAVRTLPDALSTARSPAPPTAEAPPPAKDALRLAGTVRSPGGEPVAGAIVHSIFADGSRPERAVVSDALGHYEIDADGDLVWASHEDWYESDRCYLPSVSLPEGLDLFLGPQGIEVSLRVRTLEGIPVPGASILVGARWTGRQMLTARGTVEYSPEPPRARTDADGRARIRLPDTALVALTVIAPGLTSWNEEVALPDLGHTLEVALPHPLSLNGVCVDELGQPLWKARVEVLQHAGLVVREAETDNDGRFSVEGLGPGEYVLRAEERGGTTSARHEGRLSPEGSDPLRLELSEASSIHGVVLRGGLLLEGAEVSLSAIRPRPADRDPRLTSTDSEGRFFFGGCRAINHALRIRAPGSRQSDFGIRLFPGGGERRCSVPVEGPARAPLEVEYSPTSSYAPRLVEFHSAFAGLSAVVAADPRGSRRFRSSPLPSGEYTIVGWHPDLGTFTELVQHDSSSPHEHDLHAPEGGMLLIHVALPDGVNHEQVEVSVPTSEFNRFGMGTISSSWAYRLLPWSEKDRAFVGTLPLGSSRVDLRGDGLSDSKHNVTISPGTTHWTLQTHRGIEARLVLQHNRPGRLSLDVGEDLQIQFLTQTGIVEARLPGTEMVVGEGWIEMTLPIPASTVELRAQTKPSLPSRIGNPMREGIRRIEPGELERNSSGPRLISLELHDVLR